MADPYREQMDKFRPAAFMGDANPLLMNLSGPGRSGDAGKQQNMGHPRSQSFEAGYTSPRTGVVIGGGPKLHPDDEAQYRREQADYDD